MSLARRLNTSDAVVMGLGAMIGAGIFASITPGVVAAGSGLLIGVVIAAGLAYLNATTMAQLAAIYPESGGTYVYGRKQIGNFWGFLAGWGFVIGKIASCTAMALTFASYAIPEYTKTAAVCSVLILTFINYMGIKKTANVTKLLLGFVLLALLVVIVSSLLGGAIDKHRLNHLGEKGLFGILQSAGMMFFAFAGYARIATLGEEVIEPKSTIPKAIQISLGITVALYLIIVTTVLLSVDIEALVVSKAPLTMAVQSGQYSFMSPIVRLGASFACLGVLLSLLAGVSRTAYAMAIQKDLPKILGAVHPQHKTPHMAEVVIGLIVAVIVSMADIRSAIGFSSFAILTYYAIANVAAWTLTSDQRLWPKWMCALGFLSCMTIAFSLPSKSIIGGLILFVAGSSYYFFVRRNKAN